MGDSNPKMLDSRVNEGDFMFAFNNRDFSDCVLRLEIIPDDNNSVGDSNKLRGEKYHEWFSCIQTPDHSKDSEPCDNDNKVETLHIGSSDDAQVKTLHISSIILAAKSPFFYELFQNSLRESQQKNDVYFVMKASEEATLMDILNFMYGNTLRATSFSELVDVLVPMSLEYALSFLELPSSVLACEIVKPVIDVAKQCVTARYKDLNESQDEVMDLPLSAIEAILGGEGLQVISEDDVFDFILKWTRHIYPELEWRREILTELARVICFSKLSCSKLKEFLDCPDFNHEKVSKLVLKALCSKVELCCGQHVNASQDLATIECGLSRRVYSPRCVVYFDLNKDEMNSLFKSTRLQSQTFCLGGKRLYILAICEEGNHEFGLFVCKGKEQPPQTCTLDIELSVMSKSLMEFQSKFKVSNHALGNFCGKHKLLGMPWTELMSDDCDYFINCILHLRADLTLNKSKA